MSFGWFPRDIGRLTLKQAMFYLNGINKMNEQQNKAMAPNKPTSFIGKGKSGQLMEVTRTPLKSLINKNKKKES